MVIIQNPKKEIPITNSIELFVNIQYVILGFFSRTFYFLGQSITYFHRNIIQQIWTCNFMGIKELNRQIDKYAVLSLFEYTKCNMFHLFYIFNNKDPGSKVYDIKFTLLILKI